MKMTHAQFMKYAKNFMNGQISILEKKNVDYSMGGESDVVKSHYLGVANIVGVNPLQVWAVLMSKHITAVMSYVKGQELRSESIHDRLLDLANYCILGSALITLTEASVGEGSGSASSPSGHQPVEPNQEPAKIVVEEGTSKALDSWDQSLQVNPDTRKSLAIEIEHYCNTHKFGAPWAATSSDKNIGDLITHLQSGGKPTLAKVIHRLCVRENIGMSTFVRYLVERLQS